MNALDHDVFCAILAGRAPATMVAEWDDAAAFIPLGQHVPHHVIVVPRICVPNALVDDDITAAVSRRRNQLARRIQEETGIGAFNLLTSVGEDATQTIAHYHEHIVPRGPLDGLVRGWPWRLA